MGMGHQNTKQTSLFTKNNWQHKFSHGGELRKKQAGRGYRPLSSREPIHAVFKVERLRLRHKSLRTPQNFKLVLKIIQKYSQDFTVKIEQLSIQNDHVHLLIRSPQRKQFHYFFRVVAGQIAQIFAKEGLLSALGMGKNPTEKTRGGNKVTHTLKPVNGRKNGLWKHRPFTRVVRGWKAYQVVRDYIQLNEKEARGEIRYQKNRLRGLSSSDWKILWTCRQR